jgi:broad specificity phosphatase PhoE/predicted kinase
MPVEKVKEPFLYIVMAGLPARGKSTVANKLRDSLKSDGIRTRIFNNGDLRRRLGKGNTAYPEFFDPNNETGSALRERCSAMTLNYARTFIDDDPAGRKVAIIDASNVSRKRREKILKALPEERVLFIECINDDSEILEANLLNKVETPEFAHLSRKEAVASFKKRISYYETTYQPLKKERNFIKLDTFNSRILKEKFVDGIPFEDRIRDFLVTPYIKNLYLIRHTETFYNLEDRIGGDSELTPRGRAQAGGLARHLRSRKITHVFTSMLSRTIQTAEQICKVQEECRIIPLRDFNEISSGICDNMTYTEIKSKYPKIATARKRKKYFYCYPGGEGYVSMEERIWRGVKKVIYLSRHTDNIMIVGHRAVNRMILSSFVFKRREDVPYIYMPQDSYYQISISQNKKVFQLKKFA